MDKSGSFRWSVLVLIGLGIMPVASHAENEPNPGAIVTSIISTILGEPKFPVRREIFITKREYTLTPDTTFPASIGEFGDLRGADWQCNESAFSAGKLPGWDALTLHYRAILSTSSLDAKNRFNSSLPYYNGAGQLMANNATELWSGTLLAQAIIDEYGNEVGNGALAWTGTTQFGNGDSNGLCSDWNSAAAFTTPGNPYVTGAGTNWMEDANNVSSCSSSLKLYCVSTVLPASD